MFFLCVALEGRLSDSTEFKNWLIAETACCRRRCGGHLISVPTISTNALCSSVIWKLRRTLALRGLASTISTNDNAMANLDAAQLGANDVYECLALTGYFNAATNVDAAWLGVNDPDKSFVLIDYLNAAKNLDALVLSANDVDECLVLIGYFNAAANLDVAWLGVNDFDQEVRACACSSFFVRQKISSLH